jgi:hypothetical protein
MEADFQSRVLREITAKRGPLDTTAGGVLQPGGQEVAAIFGKPARTLSRAQIAARTLRTIARARDAFPWKWLHDTSLLGMGYIREFFREPGDTDFLRDRDSGISNVIRDFVRRLMLQGSGFAGGASIAHFRKAVHLHRKGEPVMFQIVPHTSEMEPVFLDVIVQDVSRQMRDCGFLDDTELFLDQNVTAIGQKVGREPFRRMFSRSVRSVSVIAPKYRHGHSPDHERIVSAYVGVSAAIQEHLRDDARHILVVCPEGGRNTDGNIGFHKVAPPENVWNVPCMFSMPYNFVGIDAPEDSRKPSKILLHCGEPFQAPGRSNAARLASYIHMMRQQLDAVRAPVGRFAWGAKRVGRNGCVDPTRGATEFFEEIIPKVS